MPISGQPLFERWQEMRRRHRAEREFRAALHELNDHLLKDIGLPPCRTVRERWP